MPRHSKRPTEFISDDEADNPFQGNPDSSADNVIIRSTPAKVVETGPLAREKSAGCNDDEVNGAKHLPLPNTVNKQVEVERVRLAELVSILASSNASMRGKIDDSGRFELSFEFNQERQFALPVYEGPRKPDSVIVDSPRTHRGRRSSGSISGWKRDR